MQVIEQPLVFATAGAIIVIIIAYVINSVVIEMYFGIVYYNLELVKISTQLS